MSSDQETSTLLPNQGTDEKKGGLGVGKIVGISVGVCGLVLVIFLVVVCIVVQNMLNKQATDAFLHMQYKHTMEFVHGNLTPATFPRNSWYPGCGFTYKSISDDDDWSCLEPCLSPEHMLGMETYFTDHPSEIVPYPSREHEDIDTITLRGWLYPQNTTSSRPAPRIVVQHGFTANSNQYRSQSWAYLLHSMGFTVLLNNLRDHGYSDNTTDELCSWGHAYPYDLLGAWDYMVNDPDNKMGGPVDPNDVGIVGYSMGAFLTSTAFGMEPKVPAVFIDSGPVRPENAFIYPATLQAKGMGLGPFSEILAKNAWSHIDSTAKAQGVDLEENIPADTLPKGPNTQRPVFWWHNVEDTTVSIKDGRTLLGIYEDYPEKYSVTKQETDGKCHGVDHCVDLLPQFTEMSNRVCTFFAGALDAKPAGCS